MFITWIPVIVLDHYFSFPYEYSYIYFIHISTAKSNVFPGLPDRQTDRYFIDRKKVNPDLFVIEIEICTCIYNIVNLLKSYDNIHSMTYITKIMLTGIAIRNTGYILKIRLNGIARVTYGLSFCFPPGNIIAFSIWSEVSYNILLKSTERKYIDLYNTMSNYKEYVMWFDDCAVIHPRIYPLR